MAGEHEVHVPLLDDGQPEVADLGRVGALRPAPEGRCVHQHDRPSGRVLRQGLVEECRLLGHPTAERVEDHDPHALVVDEEPGLALLGEPVLRPVEVRAEGLGLVGAALEHQHALLVVADRDHPVPGPRGVAHRREQVRPLGSLVRTIHHIPGLQHEARPWCVGKGPAQRRAGNAAVVDLGVAEPDDGQRRAIRAGGRECAPLAGAAGGDDPVLVGGARGEAAEGGRVSGLRRAGELHRGGGTPRRADLLGSCPGYAVGDPLPLGPSRHGPGDALRGGRIRGRGQQDPRGCR